jgi:hypothetical protein
MEFETLDLSVTSGSGGQLWLSALSRLGVVHGIPSTGNPAVQPSELALSALAELANEFRRAIGQGRRQELTPAAGVPDFLRRLVFGVDEVLQLYQRTRGAAVHEHRGLVIRVLASPAEVAALPWELLPDPDRGVRGALTLARNVHVTRLARSRTYPVRNSPLPPPLRLLLVLASPPLASVGGPAVVAPPFDIYEEKRLLLGALAPLIESGQLTVDVADRPTLKELRERIARHGRGYHLLHYLGHAVPEGLVLEDGRGHAALTPVVDFMGLLHECPDLRLAFFAGCMTAQIPELGPAAPAAWPGSLSLADVCVRDACPTVVGMQAKLAPRTERLFSQFFYQALANGRSVPEAVALGRAAVYDDEHVGRTVNDWAVPCLFFGGEPPGALIQDGPAAPPRPRAQRVELRLNFREGQRQYFARHTRLRQVVDYLSGRSPGRLLWIYENAEGRTARLIDRALEDADNLRFLLTVSIDQLFTPAPPSDQPPAPKARPAKKPKAAEPDPIRALCELVSELLTRGGVSVPECHPKWNGAAWWARLLDALGRERFAVVLYDDAAAPAERLGQLEPALRLLAERDVRARLVVVSPLTQVVPGWNFLVDWCETVCVPAADFREEVWPWIQRHLPPLTRFSSTVLGDHYQALGPRLELWEELAREVAPLPGRPGLSPLVAVVTGRGAARPQPLAPKGRADTLWVACTSEELEGRQAEFAAALTALAETHQVGGRMIGDANQAAAGLGRLLPFPSPFERGESTTVKVVEWLAEVIRVGARVVLLNVADPKPQRLFSQAVGDFAATGVVIICPAGTGQAPVYPAWLPEVFAIGNLGPAPASGPASAGAPPAGSPGPVTPVKPDLFAPDTLPRELERAVRDPASVSAALRAALQAVAAAVLVWATDRRQTALEVRRVLESTADPSRRLDTGAAVKHVREHMIRRALDRGPLPVERLVAACPLPVGVVVAVADEMVRAGSLRRERGEYGLTIQPPPTAP